MVGVLDRKLLRDLRAMRGQVLTVSLVVAAGIASFITLRSTLASLTLSRDAYYEQQRFGDVFASLERAPEVIAERLEEIPGVDVVHTRVKIPIRLPLPDVLQPAVGVAVSIPADGEPPVNALRLVSGRMPVSSAPDEAVLLAAYADEHGILPGATLLVVMEEVQHRVHVVGIAQSPEFVYPVSAGAEVVPDDERFAVLWMERGTLARAAGLEGAFNDVVLRLQRGAFLDAVIDQVDRVLDPYGGLGAVGQDRQASNRVLTGELEQLQSLGTSVPLLFLAVAAFLLNVVLSRLVLLQRTQIAVLKAVGYTNLEVGLHFLRMVAVIVLLGAALGLGLGAWLGGEMTALYARVFGLPDFRYELTADVLVVALLVSVGAAFVGAGTAVSRVVRLAPAEAMRPAPPASYRPTVLERLGLDRLLGPSARMVVRELERTPVRTVMSILGLALAVGILVVGRFNLDAVDALLRLQFENASREDLSVAFTSPLEARAVRSLAAIPGVERAEALRSVPVRFRAGHRERDGILMGYPPGARLRQVVGLDDGVRTLPPEGALLTDELGRMLDLRVGDEVTVEVLEGARELVRVTVAGFVDEKFGLQGHMRLDALLAVLDEEQGVSGALLTVDPAAQARVERRLADMPAVANVSSLRDMARRFREQIGETVVVMTLIVTLFAATIAVGVVYNNARIALSVRSRDLASLRVLGLTRREISAILLGELAVQLLLALPVGLVIGRWMSAGIASMAPAERIRIPVVISLQTYAFAITVVLLAGLVSALLVRRQLDRLDLVAVLKAPE